MPEARPHNHPRPGTDEYIEHVREEIEHYGRIYESEDAREILMQPVPNAWTELELRASALIKETTGNDLLGQLIDRLRGHENSRMLSLGSGPGGVEIEVAQSVPATEVVCMDINPDLLELGRQRAEERSVAMQFLPTDLNTVILPPKAFDVVFCHAALHHVIELEALADQIGRTLRPGGVLITVDVITQNGYLMWPETRKVVQALWKTLPVRYRLNHTAYTAPLIDDDIWEADTSTSGMECARSEDILPVIDSRFVTHQFVPYFSISRRFFDTMYGPNYNMANPLDKAIFELIWQLDRYYLETQRLQPETFFGIYGVE
ncbi:MAG TPA: methyltransferase domain-containing protein [Stellaceae bacterium]|jgi:SAM-dependent methyltransferase|nr:methyltransferase domain-containing protein [Stellaceae bacterium]